jgi:broad specificity phosphatase PhoE
MTADLQLVLVRHGETEWTERGLLHGRLDSPLSRRGRRHAEQVAARLQGESFEALYSSPQGRALETAAIIGQAIGLNPEPVEGLREAHYGWLEGRPITHYDPAGLGTKMLRPLAMALLRLTAEQPDQVAGRVLQAVETITTMHPSGRVLVVTHWGVLNMIMACLVDRDPRVWKSHGPWVACGITELHARDGRRTIPGSTTDGTQERGLTWEVVRLNDSGHLQEEKPA